MSVYKPDPWHEGGEGEKFYIEAFAGGVCKYCGNPVGDSPLALCECSGLRLARHALKMKLYGPAAAPVPPAPAKTVKDNPDRNHAPKETPEFPL